MALKKIEASLEALTFVLATLNSRGFHKNVMLFEKRWEKDSDI